MANKVTIDVEARDRASSTFERINSLIESASFKGTLLGNVFSNAVSGGIGIAQNALEKLTGQLTKAVNTELAMVNATSSLSASLNIPWQQAEKMNLSLSKQLELLSNDLPGSAEDYVGLLRLTVDDIAAGTNALGLGLDDFEKKVLSIAPKMSILARNASVSVDMAAATISKFMSGGSGMGELTKLDFFQKNVLLKNNLEKIMKEQGIDQLDEINVGERLQLLEKIINASLSDETLDKLGDTLSGTWEGFLGSLFGEQTGILSIMRDLNETTEGTQSVFTEIKVLATSVLGKGGLFSSIANLLQSLGINIDIMPKLRDGVISLNQFVQGITQYLTNFTSGTSIFVSFSPQRLGLMLGTLITDMFSGLVSVAPSLIDSLVGFAINGIQTLVATMDSIGGSKFGGMVAILVTKITEGGQKVVPYLVNGLVKGTNFAIDAMVGFLGSMDWERLFVGLGSALSRIDWGSLAVTVLKVASIAVVVGIVGFFGSLISGVALLVGAVILGLSAIVTANGDKIIGFFQSIGDAIYNAIVGFFQLVLDFEATIRNLVISGLTNIVNGLTTAFNTINNLIGKALSVINQIPLAGSVSNIGKVTSTIIPSKAEGYFPNGLLMGALAESKKMPSGSRLLMANSSEAILTRNQQSVIASNLRNPQSSSTVTIGSINVYGNSNPEQTANLVIEKIKSSFNQAKLNYTTPSYS